MHIVVTGAAGFLGSHLCEALVAAEHDVTGIDCFTDYYPRADKEANLAALRDQERFTFVEADLVSAPLEPLLEGAEAVVNQAATPGLVLSWDQFDRYLRSNVTAVKRLIDASVTIGIRHVVQASTSSVYGRFAVGDEQSRTEPVSPYGVTKLAAEHLLRAHSGAFDLPFTILRYYSIYGPRQRPDMAYRIFCEQLLDGAPITIYGDGEQSRSNTYVADAVTATMAAIDHGARNQVYNVGGGSEITVREALGTLSELLEVPARLELAPERPGDQRRTAADTTKIRSELRWAPAVEPAEGLAALASWVRERRGLGG